jgi:hypothetical protein
MPFPPDFRLKPIGFQTPSGWRPPVHLKKNGLDLSELKTSAASLSQMIMSDDVLSSGRRLGRPS